MEKITYATWITIARLGLIPIIMVFYIGAVHWVEIEFFGYYGRIIAFVLFGIAAVTDWLDGYVARKRGEITDIGKILDPIADKLLVLLGFILIATDPNLTEDPFGIMPIWFAALFLLINLGRDYVISALRQISSLRGYVIPADKFGKAKTVAQFLAIGLFMLYSIGVGANWPLGIGHDLHSYFAWITMLIATALSVFSCANYIIGYKRASAQRAGGTLAVEKPSEE